MSGKYAIALSLFLFAAVHGTSAQTTITGQWFTASLSTNPAACTVITPPSPGGFVTAAGFQAVADDGTENPPFPGGAVSPKYVVATLDSAIQVQDRFGNTVGSVQVTNFWSVLGPYVTSREVFDTKIVYDPSSTRWLCTAVADFATASNSVLVAASATDDPTGAWYMYRIYADPTGTYTANYPSIGFNKIWVVIGNELRPGNNDPAEAVDSQVYAFSKADLYAGRPAYCRQFWTPNFGESNVQEPALIYDNTVTNMYLVNDWSGTNGTLGFFTIEGTLSNEVFISHGQVTTAYQWQYVAANGGYILPQLNSSRLILLDNARLQNLVYRNGSLWATHAVAIPVSSPTNSAIQWYELSAATGQVQQQGRIVDPTGQYFYGYPSIAANYYNDVLIGYSRFAATEYPNARMAFRWHTDPSNTLSIVDTLLKAGQSPFQGRNPSDPGERWGDHSATVVDPVNDIDLWTIQEYAAPTNSSGMSFWGTWWGGMPASQSYSRVTISSAQSPSLPAGGQPLTYTLTVTNSGPATANSVTVNDLLPSGATFISAVPGQGTCTNISGQVTCNLGSVPTNVPVTVTINVLAPP